MFTDGYADQKGGPEGKKFFALTLRDLLLEISDLSLNLQKEKLLQVFNDWKGEFEQIDDVLIVGLRIP
jgi:hypothetical protein